jgi:hypothetical protein
MDVVRWQYRINATGSSMALLGRQLRQRGSRVGHVDQQDDCAFVVEGVTPAREGARQACGARSNGR